jgi:HPt (histidine-containing phosphotransfer) domain-containing protein
MSDAPILDPEAIDALRALNPDDNGEFLREIAGIFLDDTPQRIAEIDESKASGDVSRFIRAAHSIKGSSSNLGAGYLHAAAEKLEHYGKANGIQGSEALIADVKARYAEAETAIRALIKG